MDIRSSKKDLRHIPAFNLITSFKYLTQDSSKAYLQISDRTLRGVLLKPSQELEILIEQVLKVLKQIYLYYAVEILEAPSKAQISRQFSNRSVYDFKKAQENI